MATSAVFLSVDESEMLTGLRDAAGKLDASHGELTLDFSAVRRIDADALAALQELARAAGDKSLKVVLRGVNADIYKVLKLVKVACSFSFVS